MTEDEARLHFARPFACPGLPKRRHPFMLFKVWELPSHRPHAMRVVCSERPPADAQRPCLVRRLACDPRLPDLSKCMFASEAVLDPQVAQRLMAELTSFRFQPFSQANMLKGLDGVRKGIEPGDPLCGARIAWQDDAPQTWPPLDAWFEATVRTLDAALPRSLHAPA